MAGSRLTDGFRDLIELRWDELVALEGSKDATNFDSIITSLARACMKGNLRSIQVALDRIDGRIANEIEVEYPKFYTLYPQATIAADDPTIIDLPLPKPVDKSPTVPVRVEEELPTGSLRATLDKLLNAPKDTVPTILGAAASVDKGDMSYGNPLVKSVIVAGLMKLVHDGRMGAVFEVLEQIDGKVKDKYKVLGDDVFMYNYATIAPVGAVKNDDGIYQIAAENTTNAWVARLEEKNNAKR